MGCKTEQFHPSNLRLLERLMEVSGLPLADLQFLARGGLLNTCLKHQFKVDYSIETWNTTLSILFGSKIELWDRKEIAVWLDEYDSTVLAVSNRCGIQHRSLTGDFSNEQRL